MIMTELDPEEKQKRIDRIMEHTKEEIATQWVTLGTDMNEKYAFKLPFKRVSCIF